jgi:hypothetical protein
VGAIRGEGDGVIYREHTLGIDGDLTVKGSDGAIAAPMTLVITNGNPFGGSDVCVEWLSRADVERLRDLCEEALS